MNTHSTTRSTVVIVGAGYAGVSAANRASRRHRVVLVNDSPLFVDRIRLHQHIATGRSATSPLRRMLRDDVDLVIGTATRVADGEVTLADGSTIAGDHIVLAVGSGAGVGTLPWAERARGSLVGLNAGARVDVVGGGLTGIETASEIAESHPGLRVRLLDRNPIGADLSEAGARHLRASLGRLGVEVADAVEAADDGQPAALTIHCTGLTVPSLAADSGLPVDGAGRLRVDATLRVPGADSLWGVGDAVVVEGAPHLRMSCAAAQGMVPGLVRALSDTDAGGRVDPVDVGFVARCLSLGRRDAVVQLVTADDAPTRAITGRMGAVTKEAICRYAWGTMTWLNRLYAAPRGPRAGERSFAGSSRG